MVAKNVKVYGDLIDNQKPAQKRFYQFYNDSCEKLELSEFLNSVVDFEENSHNIIKTKIYGIINQEIAKEYEVILTFNNANRKKNYMIYTDHQYDQNFNKKIYCAKYDEDASNPFLGFLEFEELREMESLMDAIFLYKH